MRAARVLPVMEVKVGHLEKQNRKNIDALKFENTVDGQEKEQINQQTN